MLVIYAATVVLIGCAVVWTNKFTDRHSKNGDWQHCGPATMRRFVAGKWDYRDATPDEQDDRRIGMHW